MTQREITEMLRNSGGLYFGENTPAMLALETMVDTVGMRNVLYALAQISCEKADHLRHNWQDMALAKVWDQAAVSLRNNIKLITKDLP